MCILVAFPISFPDSIDWAKRMQQWPTWYHVVPHSYVVEQKTSVLPC